MYLMFRTVLITAILSLPGGLSAQSTAQVPPRTAPATPIDMSNYDDISRGVFWSQLYAEGGWTLYCGYRFDLEGRSQEGYAVGIDAVYATEWMLDHLQCRNRTECYAKNPEFRVMEADMHNLYPAWSDLIVYRNGRIFGNVPGKESRFDQCEFEWDAKLVEPRDLSKGNVARSVLYMHWQYKLTLSPYMTGLMKTWNREDPPSEQEKVRNDRIEKLQGRRNPFIDNPSLADRPGPARGR